MNALVVIDMQKDFVDGTLGTPGAVAIVPRVVEKVEAYRKRGAPVIFTRDTHGPDYRQTGEGRRQPIEHCVKDTPGWQIIDTIDTAGGVMVDKTAYGSLQLPDVVRQLTGVDGLELIGVHTDVCVISNALILRTAFPDWPLVVDASCCSGSTPESHRQALDVMKNCRILVVNER